MARNPAAAAIAAQPGWVAHEVAEEFPALALHSVEIPARIAATSPPDLERQIRNMSDRWRGARAIQLRREPVPAAYRIFFRHIGLDPDVTRTPIEAAIFRRLLDGGFIPTGHLADILLMALIETGVPVWALAAEHVEGPLGIRQSRAEPLGYFAEAPQLQPGQLVIADARCALAVLFGVPAPGHEPHHDTRRLILFTIQVDGVPAMHIEEALWICSSSLAAS
jgi:DNA/RNA-binding domain of Phe-tRNA-synthetase-like protein